MPSEKSRKRQETPSRADSEELTRWRDHDLDKLAEAAAFMAAVLARWAREAGDDQMTIDKLAQLEETLRHLGIPF